MSPASSRLEILKDRAAMMKAVRLFFETKDVLEVDTPILSKAPPLDAFIDILETEALPSVKGYFHSSPEYGMKKLLAAGLGDIFQLCHVFRQGELSPLHQIEFTMLEWYRHRFSFDKLIQETCDLISLFLDKQPCKNLRYEEAFEQILKINPFLSTEDQLRQLSKDHGLSDLSVNRETALDFLWNIIEKDLGRNSLTCITHFPAWQAALSKVFQENNSIYACRFEIYCEGVELANGYHELIDANEQARRFERENEKRKKRGKPTFPLDLKLLSALNDLACDDLFGVAVGFDRLMMLRHKTTNIENILPLGWDNS